jgi:prophage endopeptidase
MTPAQLQVVLRIGAAVLLALALAGAGFFAAWRWQDNRYTAQLATQASNHQSDLTAITNAGAAQARQAVERQQQAQAALAALDARATQEKTNALAENEKLRAAVAAGYRRLRIAGACSANSSSTGGVPQASGTAGLGYATSVELSIAAGSTVFDIRAGAIADQAALRVLQEYAKTCQQ